MITQQGNKDIKVSELRIEKETNESGLFVQRVYKDDVMVFEITSDVVLSSVELVEMYLKDKDKNQ